MELINITLLLDQYPVSADSHRQGVWSLLKMEKGRLHAFLPCNATAREHLLIIINQRVACYLPDRTVKGVRWYSTNRETCKEKKILCGAPLKSKLKQDPMQRSHFCFWLWLNVHLLLICILRTGVKPAATRAFNSCLGHTSCNTNKNVNVFSVALSFTQLMCQKSITSSSGAGVVTYAFL